MEEELCSLPSCLIIYTRMDFGLVLYDRMFFITSLKCVRFKINFGLTSNRIEQLLLSKIVALTDAKINLFRKHL